MFYHAVRYRLIFFRTKIKLTRHYSFMIVWSKKAPASIPITIGSWATTLLWDTGQDFLLFRYCLPLKKDMVLQLSKLEFPTPKDALCPVELKSAQLFWRRQFSNFVNVFPLCRSHWQLRCHGKDQYIGTSTFLKSSCVGRSNIWIYLLSISMFTVMHPFF